mgnify:CR=1 FL=1
MEKQFIYADNAATTKMSDVAVKAMLPYLQEIYANASSVHLLGQRSAAALFSARQQVAQVLNCAPKEVFFTRRLSALRPSAKSRANAISFPLPWSIMLFCTRSKLCKRKALP